MSEISKPKKTRDEFTDALKVYVPFALIIIAGFVAAFYFVRPAPPSTIRMATGTEGGAYATFGERYKAALAKEGITLELVETRGSLENLDRLTTTDDEQRVSVAFVQGGIGEPPQDHTLESLGGMFAEPVWVFVRGDERPTKISDLVEKRIAVGRPGSGTLALGERILEINNVPDDGTNLVRMDGRSSIVALKTGDVDAAFFVTAGYLDVFRDLMAEKELHLLDFQRAETYARLDPVLTSVILPEGGLDLGDNLPNEPVKLLAPVAHLLADKDLHPALASLLAQVANRIHQEPSLFAAPGAFPSVTHSDYPLNDQARRYYENGPSFLRQYLPFWAANLIQRLIVLAVPLITLLIPLIRIAPPTYRWQVRRRIYRWYGEIRDIEAAAEVETDDVGRSKHLEALDKVRRDVADVRVPLSYAEQLYHLRTHIEFVQQTIIGRSSNLSATGALLGDAQD